LGGQGPPRPKPPRSDIGCQAWRASARFWWESRVAFWVTGSMFSTPRMAVPAHLLERLPAQIWRGEPASSLELPSPALSTGRAEVDEALPDGGLPRGAVVELAISGGAALGTSLALSVCRAAQEEAARHGGGAQDVPWCAVVDPSATLHGPGVESAGLRLDRLLVVRPPTSALERTAIRLVESQAFAVVVIDTAGVPGAPLEVGLGSFPRVVRRIALAAEETGSTVLLVTDAEARRPLPLPVALRLELARLHEGRLSLRIAKDKRGRISGPRSIVWAKPRAQPLVIAPEHRKVAG
jgi:recombination protein RecA